MKNITPWLYLSFVSLEYLTAVFARVPSHAPLENLEYPGEKKFLPGEP
jgi:hypothetical protein